MKIINLLLAGFVFVGLAAYADIPPPPGSTATAKIEGSAAQILYDSLSEQVGEVPSAFAIHTTCGNNIPLDVTVGKTHSVNDGKILVVCARYYCMGHKAVCNLQEQY